MGPCDFIFWKSGDLVRWHQSQTLKDSATQLLRSRNGALVTQCSHVLVGFLEYLFSMTEWRKNFWLDFYLGTILSSFPKCAVSMLVNMRRWLYRQKRAPLAKLHPQEGGQQKSYPVPPVLKIKNINKGTTDQASEEGRWLLMPSCPPSTTK